jgi:Tfp pilus assembly protein PilF
MNPASGTSALLRRRLSAGRNAIQTLSERIRKSVHRKQAMIGFSALLWLIPASSPNGAVPYLPHCVADPRPAAGWAVLIFPQDENFALAAGREALARPDYPAAVCYLRLAEESRRNDPQFRSDLGDAYWGAADRGAALAEWGKSLALDPGRVDVWTKLWQGYVAAEEWDNAADALGRLLEFAPGDVNARWMLALITAARNPGGALDLLADLRSAPPLIAGKASALEAVIRAAVAQRVPEYIFARTAEELLRLNQPALAKQALRLAIERNPNYGEAYALLGLAQEADGENPEESYRRGAALSPNSALACLVYGAWLRRQGELALARWWLLQAWIARPGDWTIGAELAQTDFQQGNLGEAESWVVQAVAANPKQPEAWIALAGFYIDNDFRIEESGIPAARQAVILAPENDRAVDMLGWGWYKMGDFSEAERLFLRALALNPDSAGAHLHLGLCYLEQGRAAEAGAEWETAARLDPNGSAGLRARQLLESR